MFQKVPLCATKYFPKGDIKMFVDKLETDLCFHFGYPCFSP